MTCTSRYLRGADSRSGAHDRISRWIARDILARQVHGQGDQQYGQ